MLSPRDFPDLSPSGSPCTNEPLNHETELLLELSPGRVLLTMDSLGVTYDAQRALRTPSPTYSQPMPETSTKNDLSVTRDDFAKMVFRDSESTPAALNRFREETSYHRFGDDSYNQNNGAVKVPRMFASEETPQIHQVLHQFQQQQLSTNGQATGRRPPLVPPLVTHKASFTRSGSDEAKLMDEYQQQLQLQHQQTAPASAQNSPRSPQELPSPSILQQPSKVPATPPPRRVPPLGSPSGRTPTGGASFNSDLQIHHPATPGSVRLTPSPLEKLDSPSTRFNPYRRYGLPQHQLPQTTQPSAPTTHQTIPAMLQRSHTAPQFAQVGRQFYPAAEEVDPYAAGLRGTMSSSRYNTPLGSSVHAWGNRSNSIHKPAPAQNNMNALLGQYYPDGHLQMPIRQPDGQSGGVVGTDPSQPITPWFMQHIPYGMQQVVRDVANAAEEAIMSARLLSVQVGTPPATPPTGLPTLQQQPFMQIPNNNNGRGFTPPPHQDGNSSPADLSHGSLSEQNVLRQHDGTISADSRLMSRQARASGSTWSCTSEGSNNSEFSLSPEASNVELLSGQLYQIHNALYGLNGGGGAKESKPSGVGGNAGGAAGSNGNCNGGGGGNNRRARSVVSNTSEETKQANLFPGQRTGAWTEEEHRRFLEGLEQCGKGNWLSVARDFVPTRTRTQVASHAQKYFLSIRKRFSGEYSPELADEMDCAMSQKVPATVPADLLQRPGFSKSISLDSSMLFANSGAGGGGVDAKAEKATETSTVTSTEQLSMKKQVVNSFDSWMASTELNKELLRQQQLMANFHAANKKEADQIHIQRVEGSRTPPPSQESTLPHDKQVDDHLASTAAALIAYRFQGTHRESPPADRAGEERTAVDQDDNEEEDENDAIQAMVMSPTLPSTPDASTLRAYMPTGVAIKRPPNVNLGKNMLLPGAGVCPSTEGLPPSRSGSVSHEALRLSEPLSTAAAVALAESVMEMASPTTSNMTIETSNMAIDDTV